MSQQSSSETANPGWQLFAVLLVTLVGAMNIVDGLVAISEDRVLETSDAGLVIADYTTWGVVHLVAGIAGFMAGIGLMSRKPAARSVAIVLAAANAVVHTAYLPAFPLGSLIVIGLDVLILYALTARWE